MRNKQEASPTLELSSMIDIVFLLLIFFVISSSFQTPTLDIELTRTESGEPSSKTSDPLNIYINKNGQPYINNTPVTHEMIKNELTQRYQNKAPNVIIYPDNQTKSQALIQLMDTLKTNNVTNISIGTEQQKPWKKFLLSYAASSFTLYSS